MGSVGVQTRGGLVQEDEPGIAEQRYANVAALCLPACTTQGLSVYPYTLIQDLVTLSTHVPSVHT